MNKDYIAPELKDEYKDNGIARDDTINHVTEITPLFNPYKWLFFGTIFILCCIFLWRESVKQPPIASDKFSLYLETSVGTFQFHPRIETAERMLNFTNGGFSIININIKKN